MRAPPSEWPCHLETSLTPTPALSWLTIAQQRIARGGVMRKAQLLASGRQRLPAARHSKHFLACVWMILALAEFGQERPQLRIERHIEVLFRFVTLHFEM
jgi:hypothetical protein